MLTWNHVNMFLEKLENALLLLRMGQLSHIHCWHAVVEVINPIIKLKILKIYQNTKVIGPETRN